MQSWPALLLAPLIALGQLSIAYALVSPSCASQDRSSLHAVAAASVLLVLAMTVFAWRDWWRPDATPAADADPRRAPTVPTVTRADSGDAQERPHFVAQIAVVVGALSTLVAITLWLPIWILSPCY
ncbi:MAG TPA: hypothetical protein VLD35_18640 [Caldimonas sp.]|nr:hypothetical protein [Caldimonas sp.]